MVASSLLRTFVLRAPKLPASHSRLRVRAHHPRIPPRVALQVQPLRQIERPPVERNHSVAQERKARRVEAGPGEEGIATAVSPDLNSGGWPRARAAGVETARVGDDQRILLDREGCGRAVTETPQLFGRDAEGAAG